MLSYVAKHSKQRKTTKVIKLQWIASIWCQKHQTNAKLQKWSYFDEFQSIWRQNYQNIWVRSQNYKSNQITMDCIDLMSKQSKMLSYIVKHSKLRKTTKEIKLQWIASIWHQNDLKCWDTSQNYKCDHITMNLHRFDVKTITTTHNYEIDQIIMHCINLTSKRSKKLSYVPKLQKSIKLQWIASIWCQNNQECWVTSQNIQNYAKLQKWSKRWISIDLTSKLSKHVELGRKTTKAIKLQWIASIWRQNNLKMLSYVVKHSKLRKTTKEIKLQWICIDLTSERSKMLRYVAKLQMWSYYDEFASIWRQNDQECWGTSQNIQNNAKLQMKSNYNEFHRFDIRTI